MNETSKKSYDWLRQIDVQLAEKTRVFSQNSFSFPWESLENTLKETFQESTLSLSSLAPKWLSCEDLQAGFGREAKVLQVELAPLKEPVFFLCSKEQLLEATSHLLQMDIKAALLQKEFGEAILLYVLALILKSVDQLSCLGDLKPSLGAFQEKPPSSSSLIQDLSLTLGKKTIQSRLIFTEEFLSEWKQHQAHQPPEISQEKLEATSLSIAVEVGKIEMNQASFSKLSTGDFLILDRCSLDPSKEGKGRVTLTLNQTPLFRGRLTNEGLKLLEYPIFQKE